MQRMEMERNFLSPYKASAPASRQSLWSCCVLVINPPLKTSSFLQVSVTFNERVLINSIFPVSRVVQSCLPSILDLRCPEPYLTLRLTLDFTLNTSFSQLVVTVWSAGMTRLHLRLHLGSRRKIHGLMGNVCHRCEVGRG